MPPLGTASGSCGSVYRDLLSKKTSLAIVGLGYVGLPLVLEFGKKVKTIGFDIDQRRIAGLLRGMDRNREYSHGEIRSARLVQFTADEKKLGAARFFIVAVPTPVTAKKRPDLGFVKSAARVVGRHLKKGSFVVFEPTVYPGVTEEICVPILEKTSGLKCGRDFKIGYSPERMNPGDRKHTVASIVKVVSAMDGRSLGEIARVYGLIVKAGVFKAQSIKCAEAAKVIENAQRDLNIAFMNELTLIFHKMGIDTRAVLDAAMTKWNFIKFFPGLVGGHCIGVDPYYLTHKAEKLGYHPQVILSGRRINDSMGAFVADETLALLGKAGKRSNSSKVLVMGITFKENVSDIRNSRVIDIIRGLKKRGVQVTVSDPLADPLEVKREYGIDLKKYSKNIKADAIVIAVAHEHLKKMMNLRSLMRYKVVVDVKGIFKPKDFEGSGTLYWRL